MADHPLDLPDIERLIAALVAGNKVSFSRMEAGGLPPFTIQGVPGGYVVRDGGGEHIGSYASLDAAWRAGAVKAGGL